MTTWRTCLIALLCMLVAACPALAAPPASKPAAEPVLKVIPAGTMGYAVLNNLKTATDDVDKFLKQIGVAELIKEDVPSGVLKELLAKMELGDGINPNGGVAIAMLDPNDFGVDLIKMMKSAIPGASTSQPAAAAPMPPLPVVVFLPGTGVKEVLGKFKPEPAGSSMKVNVHGLDLFASQVGSYVLVSPNSKALEAVAKATKKADDELTGRNAVVIRGSALAIHLNLKAVYPVLQKAAKALDLLVSAKDEGLVDFVPPPVEAYKTLKPMMGAYLYQLSQMDDMTLGVRIGETGVLMDAVLTYLPDTAFAKGIAAYKAPEAPLMDSLSAPMYMMAMTAAMPAGTGASEINAKNLDALLENPLLAKIPREQRDKIQALHKGFMEELTEVGFLMSGVPTEDKGIMSFSLVLKGRDSQKIKSLLADGTAAAADIIKALAGDNAADLEGLKVTYKKDVDKVDGISADSITLEGSALEDGMFSMIFSQVFGEVGIAPLVAAADKNTVVITFGGGTGTLGRALKAAQGKDAKDQRILAQKETVDVMKFMPKNPQMLLFFNVGNYFDMMVAGMKKMSGGRSETLPFAITSKTPIAVGVGAEGASQVVTCYFPTDVIKEIVGVFTSLRSGFGGGGGQPAKPVPGGEEF